MGPKKRPTTKSATPSRGGKRAKSNDDCGRPHQGSEKQSLASSSSSSTMARLSPRIDEVHLRLSKLIEKAKEHMEVGRRLSEEWVSCEAEVEDIEHLTTMLHDHRLLNLRNQLDDVNTIMSGVSATDDDSSDC